MSFDRSSSRRQDLFRGLLTGLLCAVVVGCAGNVRYGVGISGGYPGHSYYGPFYRGYPYGYFTPRYYGYYGWPYRYSPFYRYSPYYGPHRHYWNRGYPYGYPYPARPKRRFR